jgi:hypothetical protein
MATRTFLIILLIIAAVICPTLYAYAQDGMRNSTSGNSVDVLVEPTWNDGGQATFKVSFLRPGTDTLQVHIDYTFVIMKDGEEVFDAGLAGQPLLHTAEGLVTIPQSPQPPYQFQGNGDYSIAISVHAINFLPITPETSTFPITVVPEFPVGGIVTALLVASMTTAVVLSQRFRLI